MNPRSLLVLTDVNRKEFGFGIQEKKGSYVIYLRTKSDTLTFRQVESNDVNHVFSTIITSGFVTSKLEYILADSGRTYDSFKVRVTEGEMQLPPREEYEIEDIKII